MGYRITLYHHITLYHTLSHCITPYHRITLYHHITLYHIVSHRIIDTVSQYQTVTHCITQYHIGACYSHTAENADLQSSMMQHSASSEDGVKKIDQKFDLGFKSKL